MGVCRGVYFAAPTRGSCMGEAETRLLRDPTARGKAVEEREEPSVGAAVAKAPVAAVSPAAAPLVAERWERGGRDPAGVAALAPPCRLTSGRPLSGPNPVSSGSDLNLFACIAIQGLVGRLFFTDGLKRRLV